MTFIVATKRGAYEVRESHSTPKGPRSRTLATFKELNDDVIRKAQSRTAKALDAEELRGAALRAGAPVALSEVDEAARDTLRLLAKGNRPDPMLRRLLLDALTREDRSDRPADPDALVSDTARSATEWIGVDAAERGRGLRDLLELADALPNPNGPAQPGAGTSLPEKVEAIHRSLNAARVSHAFGGAIALAYYGEPRTTIDIDVNVFVPTTRWNEIGDALARLGIETRAVDAVALARDSRVQILWDRNLVDIFFSCDPLHEEMRGATRRVPFGESMLPIVAPEHLAVRKAVIDRTKDWLDIEQILVATDPLDVDEIETWLVPMVGESDPRMQKLHELRDRLSIP
jgi:hypothetical protein